MCKKLIYLASVVLVLFLVSNVQAADVTWTDTISDHNWFTPENWNKGILPISADNVRIKMLPGPTIANEGAVANAILIGSEGSTGALTVDGGTLKLNNYMVLGLGVGGDGTLNMISGTVTISNGGFNTIIGQTGLGTLNMTGGTISVGGNFWIGSKATATGHVDLDSGIITANTFKMRAEVGSVGTMNVTAGMLIINGDAVSAVQGYIDDPNGWITAYGGDGTLQLDYDVTNQGKTTLKATSLLNPNPVDGGLASSGEVELSWTLPDPCVPGQPVTVDVYFTDDLQALEWFTDPAAIQVVSKQNVNSVVVQTQPKTQYYWAVDTYIGDPNDPIFGPIFSFFADNIPPTVDAGADVMTWLEEGIRIGNLDATVTDEEAPTFLMWSVVSEPNEGAAVIEDIYSEDTSVTLSAVGEYVLNLLAFDGEYRGEDTVTINVYNDSCKAAQSLADYAPIVGDLNGDCKVDEADMALLEENWLKENSLTDEWYKIE